MHLPDHYLGPSVCAISAAAAATAMTGGLLRFRRLPRPSAGSIATVAAAVFAAQMVNFPVGGGTSGHLLGGALAAILLGHWSAMFVMTTVLAVQCLLFGDGGTAALGANIFNMAVIAPIVGYAVYQSAGGHGSKIGRRMIAAALAGWVSVIAAAVACAVELAASGTHALGSTLVAMVSVHAVIGLSEALITAAVVALATRRRGIRKVAFPGWLGFAAIAVMVALAPLASSLPDGLESVAEQLNFQSSGWSVSPTTLMPDYALSGTADAAWAMILAGLIGVAICAALTWALWRAALPVHADSRN